MYKRKASLELGSAELDVVEPRKMRTQLRKSGRLKLRLTLAAGAALALASGFVLIAETAPQASTPASVAAAPPPLPAWVDIVRPIEMYSLAAPEFAKLPHVYEARRNRLGGGRQDAISFGTLKGSGSYLRLVLYRAGSEPYSEAPFFVEAARRAADAGFSIARSLPPAALQTRFGRFEVADMSLSAPETVEVACLGFRLVAAPATLRIAGFACSEAAKSFSRPALACLIDRIDLNTAGDDRALAQFFADTELRRDPACAGMRLAPTPVHASWLDPDAETPPLRKPQR